MHFLSTVYLGQSLNGVANRGGITFAQSYHPSLSNKSWAAMFKIYQHWMLVKMSFVSETHLDVNRRLSLESRQQYWYSKYTWRFLFITLLSVMFVAGLSNILICRQVCTELHRVVIIAILLVRFSCWAVNHSCHVKLRFCQQHEVLKRF